MFRRAAWLLQLAIKHVLPAPIAPAQTVERSSAFMLSGKDTGAGIANVSFLLLESGLLGAS